MYHEMMLVQMEEYDRKEKENEAKAKRRDKDVAK